MTTTPTFFQSALYFTTLVGFIGAAVLLILLVLIQKGRGGGLSSAFGGGGGSTAFGAKTGDVLTWATSVLFGIFVLTAVAQTLIVNHQFGTSSTPVVSNDAAAPDVPPLDAKPPVEPLSTATTQAATTQPATTQGVAPSNVASPATGPSAATQPVAAVTAAPTTQAATSSGSLIPTSMTPDAFKLSPTTQQVGPLGFPLVGGDQGTTPTANPTGLLVPKADTPIVLPNAGTPTTKP